MLQASFNPLLSGPVLASLGAVIAAGLGALGAAIGIGYSGSAMIGTIAEKPETFSKAMISVVLAEALGIYGLLSAFMIIMRLSDTLTFGQGLVMLSAGLAIGVAAIGGGIGIAKAGSSMCTAIGQAPETFSKSLVSVVLAEALAIYGLLSSFMLIMRVDQVTAPAQGWLGLAAALAVGLATLGGGIGIAASGSSLSEALVKAPGTFSKGLVSVVLAEALAIYGLLAGFMLIMRIEPSLTAMSQALTGLAAALAIGLAAIGGGLGIARAGSALSNSLVDSPDVFSKGLVAVVLAEALAIYGLLAAFMLIMRIGQVLPLSPDWLMAMGAAVGVGLAAIGAGYGIARAGSALIKTVADSPGAFSKGLVAVVLAEALAIYGLLIAFMVIMRVGLESNVMADAVLSLSAGLGIGLAAIGGGIGIALGGEALSSSLGDAPETFSKSLVAVVLAEALAIYGLLAAFMLIMRMGTGAILSAAFVGMAAAMTVGLGGFCAGLAIGLSGRSMIRAMTRSPGIFSKSMVPVVLAEALAIYTLLVAFMLIMRI
jgi:F0F1-type ATP synthase membrane subunit c/vacuolar-type H+-ATPase subunit K